MKKTILVMGLVCGLMMSLAAYGGESAGQSWICSISDAVAVADDGTVGAPDLDGRERPTFLRVDAAKKEVTLLAPDSRSGEVTKIDTVQQGEEGWVFSGVEEGRAWSLMISKDGYMTLSVTGDGEIWSVFGNALCEAKTAEK